MVQTVNLNEYREIKLITETYPELIKTLDKCYEMLYDKADNSDMSSLMLHVLTKKIQMEFTLGLCEEHLKGIKNV